MQRTHFTAGYTLYIVYVTNKKQIKTTSKQCMCVFRVCSFTARFSQLKCLKLVKIDLKIQDMGADNVYIYLISYSKKKQRLPFFFFFINTNTNVILFIELLYKINTLILRDIFLTQPQCCSRSLSNMTVFSSWMNQRFKWFGPVAMTNLLTVTCCPTGDLYFTFKVT